MEVHANAPLSPIGRRRVVDRVVVEGWSVAVAAEAAGVSERTVYRWLARFRCHGQQGLVDRRSVPGRIAHKTSAERVSAICALRQLRLTAAEIAERLRMPLSTVSAVLRREGLGKRSRLEPPEPVNRYERSAAGGSSTSTSRNSGGSRVGRASASPVAARVGGARPTLPASVASGSAGNTCTSRSTTTAAWPTPKSSTTKRPAPRSRSCTAPLRSSPATASASSG